MLRIAEQWFGSDVGRQRQGNEDNFFVRAPVFVVADGMGGAQAGEVASQMAVEAFEPGMPAGSSPEDGLTEIIQSANNRIHEMSRSDTQRSGMGTTTTAVYVDDREVVLAHVGDSRCYLYRNGELTRLTRDHSLVGELVDRGKLTEEQAEIHPQRSVITRALGPELDVRVDVERVEARDGDVFLLCSDGLTSMVREATLLPVLEHAKSLEQAGKSMIAAANEAGGRDNITVVLFRLEDVDLPDTMSQATVEAGAVSGDDGYDTFSGPAVTEPRQGVTRMSQEEPTRVAEGTPATEEVAAGVQATDEQEQAYQQEFATTAIPAIPSPRSAASAEAPEVRDPTDRQAPPASAPPPAATRGTEEAPRKRRRFPLKAVAVVLAVLLVVGLGLYGATRAVFFVGTDDADVVTVFRGLPYELPGGIEMYTRHYTSGVTLDQVPASRRKTFTEHKLRSLDDASDLVEQLELGKLRE